LELLAEGIKQGSIALSCQLFAFQIRVTDVFEQVTMEVVSAGLERDSTITPPMSLPKNLRGRRLLVMMLNSLNRIGAGNVRNVVVIPAGSRPMPLQ